MNQEKKSISCDLVKDLLPIYVDGLCSEESRNIINNHLDMCQECKDYHEKMKGTEIVETLQAVNGTVLEHHRKKERKKLLCIVGIVIGACLTVFVFYTVLFYIIGGLDSCISEEYMTIKESEYGAWSGHIDYESESMESGLYLFPQNLASTEDVDYLYYCAKNNLSISSYLVYTAATYSQEDYVKEVERIKNTQCTVRLNGEGDCVTNSVMYSEELFAYPAYVAVYASNLSYEYALLDEENNTIIYVYLQMKDGYEILPAEHLPLENLGKNMYEKNSWDNPNIYYAKDKYGDYMSYDWVFGNAE